MTKILEAVFDGEVLRPAEPLDLLPNTLVRITVETTDQKEMLTRSFLQTARSLGLEGPPDWSERIEDYLYGSQDNAKN